MQLSGSATRRLRHRMRHASSPREVPTKEGANPDNTKPERQLDAEGRASATAMGEALRRLKIPIGDVLSSQPIGALETVRLCQTWYRKDLSRDRRQWSEYAGRDICPSRMATKASDAISQRYEYRDRDPCSESDRCVPAIGGWRG